MKPTESIEQKFRAYVKKYLFPLLADGDKAVCSAKNTASYLTAQARAMSVHRPIERIIVAVPTRDFTLKKTATSFMNGACFQDGGEFIAISSQRIVSAVATVVSEIAKLRIPISFTQNPSLADVQARNVYVIWVSEMIGCEERHIEGLSQINPLQNKIESFIALNPGLDGASQATIDFRKRIILHELMHAFFLPHIPPLQSDSAIHLDAITEFYQDPIRRGELKSLVAQQKCMLSTKHKTIMFQQDDGAYHKPGKFSISKSDKIALRTQWQRMNSVGASKASAKTELCQQMNEDLLVPGLLFDQSRQGPSSLCMEHSSWQPTATNLRQRKVIGSQADPAIKVQKTLATEYAAIGVIYENIFVPFVFSMSRALIMVIAERRQVGIDPKTVQNIVGAVLTLLFFRIDIAILTLSGQAILRQVRAQLKAYGLLTQNHPQLELLLPFIVELFYRLYFNSTLTNLMYQTTWSIVKILTSLIASQAGSYLVHSLSKQKLE